MRMSKYSCVPVSTLVKTFFRELVFVFRIAPSQTVKLTTIQLLIGMIPPAELYLGARIIDILIHGSTDGLWSQQLVWFIGISLFLLGLQRVVFLFDSSTTEALKGELQVAVTDRVHRMIISLDLPTLEKPSVHTLHTYLKDQRWRPQQMVYILFQTIGNIAASISYIVLAATFSPWFTFLFVVAVIPSLMISIWAIKIGMNISWGKASFMKKVWYLESLFRKTRSLIEFMIHNVGYYFADQYREAYTEVIKREREIERKRLLGSLVANICTFVVYVIVYVSIVNAVLAQTISIGQFTLYIGAFVGLERFMINMAWQIAQLYEHTNYMNSFRELDELKPNITDHPEAEYLPSIETIELVDVSYMYPDTSLFALEHISFSMKKGERIAIVGENGAGKSTLVKILMRLYEPTSGIVLINGKDYRLFTLESLRKQIGVTFQDFEKYSLSARENIGVGEITHLGEMEYIQRAAEQSGIHEKISGLSHTYETMLGHEFGEGGTELSGGEWQKLALARSLIKDASLLILDEPTAALDARSEYQFFQELFKKTREQSVIVISHRFSSVRVADRIVVLEHGQVKEEGTHDELVRHKGLYAELYELQTKEIA